MPRPVHFEIPAEDVNRAIKFYETVFGWQFQKWEGPTEYWMINTGEGEPGINGGMLKRRDPRQPACNTIGVMNLDETIAAVTKNGGKLAVPKMAIPGVGWLAYCSDTEGIMFGMMQPDANAK